MGRAGVGRGGLGLASVLCGIRWWVGLLEGARTGPADPPWLRPTHPGLGRPARAQADPPWVAEGWVGLAWFGLSFVWN